MGLLRLLFALSVVCAHTSAVFGTTFVGGRIAVESFFIFSGFYMSLILSQKYIGKRKSYLLFITNRLLRIYPTYFTVLLFSLLIEFIFFFQGTDNIFSLYVHYHQALNTMTLGYLLFSNIFIVSMDWVMFLGINIHHGTFFFTNNYLQTIPQLYNFLFIPQAWTLSLELMFYSIAPFLVKRKLWILLLLIEISVILRGYLYHIGLDREPWTNRFFPTELAFFLLGIIAYRVFRLLKNINLSRLASILLLLLILFSIFYNFIPNNPLATFDAKQLSYFGLLLGSLPLIFQLTKSNRFDHWLGILSYPVYISHLLVRDILVHFGQAQTSLFGLQTVCLTFLLSTLLIIVIENPVDRYRQKRLTMKR